jgi:hypothetical protein
VTILSPGPDTWIATGEPFAVTVKVANSGPNAAMNVMVDIAPSGCDSLHYVTLVNPAAEQSLDTINAGSFKVATWTLTGGGEHDYAMRDCQPVNTTICVSATMSTDWATSCGHTTAGSSVEIVVYPAAYLVATIDSIDPSAGIVLGDGFTVNYRVTNRGVADAWNASATLGADSKVSIAAGTGGYTQGLSTIAGWTWGTPYNYVMGSFQLNCAAVGLSTLTVTPAGYDECGWDMQGAALAYTGLMPAQLPGRAIPSKFIVADSETINQSLTGECPDLTSVNISLNSGWNLISLPLIPTGGSVSVATLFSGKPVDAIWSYSGGSWVSPTTMVDGKGYWVHMTAASSITLSGVVNPNPPQTPPTYSVVTGWNLMGFKSTCARTAGSYLSGVPYVRIWGFADGAWRAIQSADKMQAGLGYWIAATGAGTIYP